MLPGAIGAQQLTVIYELEKSPHALSDLTVFNPEKHLKQTGKKVDTFPEKSGIFKFYSQADGLIKIICRGLSGPKNTL